MDSQSISNSISKFIPTNILDRQSQSSDQIIHDSGKVAIKTPPNLKARNIGEVNIRPQGNERAEPKPGMLARIVSGAKELYMSATEKNTAPTAEHLTEKHEESGNLQEAKQNAIGLLNNLNMALQNEVALLKNPGNYISVKETDIKATGEEVFERLTKLKTDLTESISNQLKSIIEVKGLDEYGVKHLEDKPVVYGQITLKEENLDLCETAIYKLGIAMLDNEKDLAAEAEADAEAREAGEDKLDNEKDFAVEDKAVAGKGELDNEKDLKAAKDLKEVTGENKTASTAEHLTEKHQESAQLQSKKQNAIAILGGAHSNETGEELIGSLTLKKSELTNEFNDPNNDTHYRLKEWRLKICETALDELRTAILDNEKDLKADAEALEAGEGS